MAVGALLLFAAHAATDSTTFSTSPLSGVITGDASPVLDSSAIGGKAVEFGTGTGSDKFVTVSGTQLILNGQPFRFIGFNLASITGICLGPNTPNWTTTQMDTYFSGLPANGVSRVFAVQTISPSYITSIVNEATKYQQHLIIVLGDDDSYCNDTDGAPNGEGSGKTLAYYQSGWKNDYLKWINQIVPPLANNTTIAMWEIANEPFLVGATFSQVGLSTAQAYINGAAAAIRADDPNHLVTIGAASVDAMGGAADYQTLFSKLDVLDFHDYSWVSQNGAVIANDFATVKQIAQTLDKPFMVDEAGTAGGTGCTTSTPNPATFDTSSNVAGLSLTARVTYLVTNKANDYLSSTSVGGAGGASGIAFWDYTLAGQSDGPCSLEIQPSDPMVSAVKNYMLPN